jgi:hypothetical protein
MTVRIADEGPGGGLGRSDPLVPVRNRPQLALSRSIIKILEDYHVVIPPYGPIATEQCFELPLAVLAVLCQAGLLIRPKEIAR